MKKSITILVVLILALSFMLAACDKGKEEKPILGVWWWSDSLGDEYLEFSSENNVTEIYYCSSKFNASTDEFIRKASSKGIKVYLLTGAYQWVENPDGAISKIEKYVEYQSKYEHKFDGIHFDIEPHQHPEFKKRRAELIRKFAELTYTVRERYHDIDIAYDIPFWFEDEITVNGITKLAFQHIIDNATRVTLMSYRDSAEEIYKVASAEINYAVASGKKLNLGVAVISKEGDNVCFEEEGKRYMYGEIAKLRTMIPDGFGVVIHQVKQWYELKD